jgi:opacity protein-like surface antigen
MKPTSFNAAAVAALLLFFCATISPAQANAPESTATSKQAFVPYFNWYLTSNNSYLGYQSEDQEINNLEGTYQVEVDTDPGGGTLLASGFFLYGSLHLLPPSINLYGHF